MSKIDEKRLWIIEARDGAWGANGICKGELVRCAECKYCYSEGFVNVRNVCEKHYDFGNVDDDWFCADGEKENGWQ